MPAAALDPARIATMLADADLTSDEVAAKRHGVSVRTLWRHRARLRQDPALAARVSEKRLALEADWAEERRTFLKAGLAKLNELVALAGVDQIRDVAGALKIVGDLELVTNALGEQSSPSLSGQTTAGDAPRSAETDRLTH